MSWFFLALLAPALYGVSNHIDKYLVEKYLSKDKFKQEDVGSLILFSTLFALIVLPIIAIFEPAVFNVDLMSALVLILNGIIVAGAIILYLHAIEKDEVSVVIPFLQLIPVFGYGLAILILNEYLSLAQIISSLVIIIAAMILSFDLTGEKIRIRKQVILFAGGASILYALTDVIFKKIAVADGFWLSAFWQYAGVLLAGLIIFASIRSYRQDFLNVFKRSKKPVIFLNFFSESLSIIGDLILRYSFLLAPIALVMVANVFQPFFVFIYGIILTIFFPQISTEKLSRRHLTQKIIAIVIMIAGAYFLYI
ncbi:MAG: EamA family transporter [Candidatus Paceibacterota bacterium]|jgi:drug/metabolite transporter (DMT)-like permease